MPTYIVDTVISVVTATPFVSDAVDRARLSILCKYAVRVDAVVGYFDPQVHLEEQLLIDYWINSRHTMTQRSRDKALSVLRTIAHRTAFADGIVMHRQPVAPPLDDATWTALRAAADRELAATCWGAEAHMLLDLTGEIGLRGSEAIAARGKDLRDRGNFLTLIVASTRRPTREVPILPSAAARLAPFIGTSGPLLRADYRNRRNTITALVDRLGRHADIFTQYRASSARHRWLAALMTEPIPLRVLLYVAGLEAHNHTIHDIAATLPKVDPHEAGRFWTSPVNAHRFPATNSAARRR